MAFGCPYYVELVVYHWSLSAAEISSLLPTLKPYRTSSIGDVKKGTLPGGKPRLATNSVWMMRLHEEDVLHGDRVGVNSFLESQLHVLAKYKDAFQELDNDGDVNIEVHLKLAESHQTAFVIKPDVMRSMAESGISLDVEISYIPGQSEDVPSGGEHPAGDTAPD